MFLPNLEFVALSVPDDIVIGILDGVANPQSWGRGSRRGSGMVPFKKALLISYRRSIVNFPVFLRVSEILPLLCSIAALFPPTSSLPQFSPCSPWSRWMAFGLRRGKVMGYNCPCT